MCLVLFAYKIDETYPLILAANRDEFYSRPTEKIHVWGTHPKILAGKDLEQGGTWFGVNTVGHFAVLTNFRDPAAIRPDAISRGNIILDYLLGTTSADQFFQGADTKQYNPFNLLFGDIDHLYWFSNQANTTKKVEPGIHGLSNAFLDTPWPKITTGTTALSSIIKKGVAEDALFNMLSNRKKPSDDTLPDTGVGIEWERILSPLFISSPGYGTLSSTLMMVGKQGNIKVVERTYAQQNPDDYTDCAFELDAKTHNFTPLK